MPRPARPVYIFAKPPPVVAERIAAHPRYNRRRGSDLLHVTVLGLFDLDEVPAEAMRRLKQVMRDYDDCVVPLFFDRLEERRAVTLRSRNPPVEMAALQSRLVAFLTDRGFHFFGAPPVPHMTISYQGDGRGSAPIAPIGWMVDELLLVESPYGKTRHIVHGRWRLRDPCPGRVAA